jgi:hypothetical protein
MKEDKKLTCLVCEKTEQEVPLIKLAYKGEELRICPQHMPLLIHEPQKLTGMIEGAENMNPA